ncbi:cyclophilin-like fold protein [Sinorhizobium garamanticum]|uniref:Cyclophilin-like fold protein n=1 Tax=Sinorhizobium garamanticum TaxID=680247 RepID=A0ABY8DLC1_9HYPH|nr:cyclophilin-like fold protein [Sinorhizobium garamanticum]WEX91057.1 cyclophilin-like fold protein [Sinorhizobium garamanticum]
MKRPAPSITRRTLLDGSVVAAALPVLAWANKETSMKVRLGFAGHNVTATLYDNPSARDFASMLPLDLTFSDFPNEKIAYLPRKLNLEARGPFPNEAPGDLCYYIPWGNLAFFYGNYVSTRDLIRLGRIDGGVEPLLTRGEFPLHIERLS